MRQFSPTAHRNIILTVLPSEIVQINLPPYGFHCAAGFIRWSKSCVDDCPCFFLFRLSVDLLTRAVTSSWRSLKNPNMNPSLSSSSSSLSPARKMSAGVSVWSTKTTQLGLHGKKSARFCDNQHTMTTSQWKNTWRTTTFRACPISLLFVVTPLWVVFSLSARGIKAQELLVSVMIPLPFRPGIALRSSLLSHG